MSNAVTIAKHEFRKMVSRKAFIILTLLGPFIVAALTILPTAINMNQGVEEGTKLALLGVNPNAAPMLAPAFQGAGIDLIVGTDEEALKDAVRSGEIDAFVVMGPNLAEIQQLTYYSKSGTDIVLSETTRAILSRFITGERMQQAGFDPVFIEQLSRRPDMQVLKVGEDAATIEGERDFVMVLLTSIGFVMMIYMSLLLYGQTIGRSILEEKTSKTVEIMLSSVRPRELLVGKIAGIGAAGILQYTAWVAVAFTFIAIAGPVFGMELPATVSVSSVLWLLVFFLLGFFLYASAYAALGSAAEDEQHLGQLSFLVIIFMIVPMMLVSPVVMNPDGTIAQVFSIFPMTAPFVMLPRLVVGAPPIIEVVICITLLVISIVLMAMLGAKIFRTGILMTGKRPTIPEIFKWARY